MDGEERGGGARGGYRHVDVAGKWMEMDMGKGSRSFCKKKRVMG